MPVMTGKEFSHNRDRVQYIGLLLLVVALALVPRLWLWYDQGRAGVVLPGDQDEYYRGAIHLLLRGDYYDDGQWLRPPMPSFFLAAVFFLTGGVNLPLAMLVQCVLSAATVIVLAEIARRLFVSRRAGVVAALIGALFLPYASYASQLLSETLYIFWIALALLLFEVARQRGMAWPWVLVGGAVWGLAALTRPVGVYALPLLMLWVVWVRLRGHHSERRSWLRAGRLALVLVAGFVLVVGPWTVRNYAVYHRFVLVDTNGGISFWLGNLLEPGERELQGVWNRTIPNSAERQQVAMARAFDNIRREPLTFLKRMRYKTVSLWQLDTRLFVANAPVGVTLDEHSLPFALASDGQYVLMMLLAICGVALARRSEWNAALLLWPLYGTLLSAVSLGHPRLRLPLLAIPIVYAALPLAHPRRLWERLCAASWWRRGGLLVGFGLFAFLIYAQAYGPFLRSEFWLAMSRIGGGEQAIERAIATNPQGYRPYVAWGQLWRERGDNAIALAAFDAAAERAPRSTIIHLQRLDLARRLGDTIRARDAMAAIDAAGWDNNLTYTHAWEHLLPAPALARLDVAAPAPGVMRGVYAVEYDGAYPFRWTMGRAQVRMSIPTPHQPRLTLVLRADRPDTPVAVFWQWEERRESSDRQDRPAKPLATVLVGPAWEQFTFSLERPDWEQSGNMPGVLELRAPTQVASPDAPYPRGVALAEAWLEEAEEAKE
jgi:4-amino-4-deoxy-L-arabinose transferase-like glycosyltransferase